MNRIPQSDEALEEEELDNYDAYADDYAELDFNDYPQYDRWHDEPSEEE